MNRQSFRSARLGLVAIAMVVSLAGCKSNPAPQATQPAATPTPTPTAALTAKPSAAPSTIAASSASASAGASAIAPDASATPEVAASAAPPASAAPSASPAAPASLAPVGSTCSGTADHLAFFAEAASKLSFNVYCASLPSTWWLQTTQYQEPSGGQLTISYKNSKGQTLSIGEGNFCAGAPLCWTSVSDLGSASFGDMSGSLKLYNNDPQYAVYVSPGTTHGYQIIGKGMTQAQFVAIAAGMVKVPKP
jgi:hypothetical protein